MDATASRRPSVDPYSWKIVVIVVAVVVAAIFSAAALFVSPSGRGPCECPASVIVNSGPVVTAGSLGCQNLQGETCFAAVLYSNIANVHLSGLGFAVRTTPRNGTNVLNGTPVELGPSAGVTALASDRTGVGTWNWSLSAWTQGGSWVVPTGGNVTLVLDTGLQNANLTGDWFWTFITSPISGAGGISL